MSLPNAFNPQLLRKAEIEKKIRTRFNILIYIKTVEKTQNLWSKVWAPPSPVVSDLLHLGASRTSGRSSPCDGLLAPNTCGIRLCTRYREGIGARVYNARAGMWFIQSGAELCGEAWGRLHHGPWSRTMEDGLFPWYDFMVQLPGSTFLKNQFTKSLGPSLGVNGMCTKRNDHAPKSECICPERAVLKNIQVWPFSYLHLLFPKTRFIKKIL